MDLGEPISRSSYRTTPLEVAGPMDKITGGIMLLDEDDLDPEPPQPSVAPAQPAPEDAMPIPGAPPIPQQPAVVSAQEDAPPVQKPKKKSKKSKKRDEIDDIFGF